VTEQVHLRRSGSGATYCGRPLESVSYIETTPVVVEHGAGAGTGVTCERCADNYRAAQFHARHVAATLKALGAKRILIKAAEQGYITELACKMPKCFCPEELGGAYYFEPAGGMSDWSPTHEHFPLSKKDGGREGVDNVVLAHRLCNRIDYSIRAGRSHKRDLERIRKAREEAIRRNDEGRGVVK
jgi:hypothetical protein